MNNPRPITPEEWDEIAASDVMKEFWPLDDDETGSFLSEILHGVYFDYQSDCPGYDGPLYLLLGGAGPETRPIGFIRGSAGELKLVDYGDDQ